MKKILSLLAAGAMLMSIGTSCSDSEYDEKYLDPSKTTTVGIPQVFTGVMLKGRQWMDLLYYRYYSQSTTSGLFSGVVGDNNTRGRFMGAGEGRYTDRWKQFYDMVTQHRLLEYNYNNLSEEEKPTYAIFFHLSRAMVDAQLHEMLSLFGDVPFNGAGTIWIDGDYDRAKQACVYDDDVTLYKQILADLKETGDYLASGNIDGDGLIYLVPQDYTIAAGDPVVWQKWVNSLRLRIALHLATNGDCVSDAHAAIAEILNNPSQYPLIESNADNMGVAASTQSDDFNWGKSMSQALRTGSYAAASQTILRVMNVPEGGIPDANTDPRLQAMYDPNPDNEYVAFDLTMSNAEITNFEAEKHQEYVNRGILTANYFCEIDTQLIAGYDTYQGNENVFSLWIGAAEVSLSKAEAYLMGYGVAADQNAARENFIKGVEQSAEFYWDTKLNSTLYRVPGNDSYRGFRTLTEPTDAEITAYAESIWEPTQQRICEQLWLNFSFMNELEAWNVVRRTGYPVVNFSRDTQTPAYATPPGRLPYPSDEVTNNSANYQAAIATNYDEPLGYYTTLFWAKSDYYHMID